MANRMWQGKFVPAYAGDRFYQKIVGGIMIFILNTAIYSNEYYISRRIKP